MIPDTTKPGHELRFWAEDDNPVNHWVKDKNGSPATQMSDQEVAAMWAGGTVKPVGLLLQADVGSTCIVVYIGGSSYKICR
jgi:hypothetical protein